MMMNRTFLPTGRHRHQAGAAALAVTLLLFFVLALVLAFANRQLVFEQRSSSNQVRAGTSLEAAQAGLDWAQALLNSPHRLDSDCAVDTNGASNGSKTWRDIQLSYAPAPRLQLSQAGLTAACLRDGNGWRCHCPRQGAASVALPAGDTPSPGFVVQLIDHPEPGHVLLRAKGCSQAGPACWNLAQATPAGQAQSHLQVQLALAGGLRTPPAAALTARGHIHGTALGAHHSEAGTAGVALHAGGSINLASPHSTTVAGGTASQAQAANDADLAGLGPDPLFSALWGMGPPRWAAQSSVLQLLCAGNCGATLQAAIARRGNRMVWIAGDATLGGASPSSPLQLGSADDPLLLVVTGKLTLLGAVQLHGAVYADELHWNNAHAAAFLRGAAWSQTDVRSDSAPQFFFDPAVLARLRWNTGSFAVLPGSWKDISP